MTLKDERRIYKCGNRYGLLVHRRILICYVIIYHLQVHINDIWQSKYDGVLHFALCICEIKQAMVFFVVSVGIVLMSASGVHFNFLANYAFNQSMTSNRRVFVVAFFGETIEVKFKMNKIIARSVYFMCVSLIKLCVVAEAIQKKDSKNCPIELFALIHRRMNLLCCLLLVSKDIHSCV